MSIQNSLNSMTTTIAGAIAAGKHAEEKKAMKEEAAAEKQAKATEQGLLAKEQYHEASADLTKLSHESEQAEAIINDKNLAKIASGKDSTGKKITSEQGKFYQSQAISEIEAANRAFEELADRIEAKKAMMSRTEAIMKRTNT